MIRLTNQQTGDEGRLIALNPKYIVCVYTLFEGETRIKTEGQEEEFIVKESFDEILAAISAASS